MFSLVESGQTQKQFCTNHRLPVHILAYWVGRYRQSHAEKTTANKAVAAESKAAKAVVATDSAAGVIRLSTPAV
jgi:hypothetical protein